jgi:hypothetical protein
VERKFIYRKIEILRNQLSEEYAKSYDEHVVSERIMCLSERLDKLIVDCMKLSISDPKK